MALWPGMRGSVSSSTHTAKSDRLPKLGRAREVSSAGTHSKFQLLSAHQKHCPSVCMEPSTGPWTLDKSFCPWPGSCLLPSVPFSILSQRACFLSLGHGTFPPRSLMHLLSPLACTKFFLLVFEIGDISPWPYPRPHWNAQSSLGTGTHRGPAGPPCTGRPRAWHASSRDASDPCRVGHGGGGLLLCVGWL